MKKCQKLFNADKSRKVFIEFKRSRNILKTVIVLVDYFGVILDEFTSKIKCVV